jgi:TetR/AcrR family transcriptional regulator, transcriptional repressor for nem operon
MARTKDFDEDAVLNKAVCLFWHKGYNGTSMQDLVDTLSISRSSLYDTYTDKHNLYLKALQFYLDSAGKRMDGLLTDAKTSKAAIKQLLELTTLDLLKDKQHKGCFMVNAEVEVASHDPEVKDIIRKSEDQIENAFRRAIQNGQKKGEINAKQDARALARFFLNTVKGIRVSAKSVSDKSTFDDVIRTALSVLN